jgi:glycosyltransferase involved in cell wall biosynthesis
VVAPTVGGLAEIVQNGQNGLLYPPGEWQTALQQLELLIQNRPLQQSLGAAAARSAEVFCMPAVIDQFLLALERLAAPAAAKTLGGQGQ